MRLEINEIRPILIEAPLLQMMDGVSIITLDHGFLIESGGSGPEFALKGSKFVRGAPENGGPIDHWQPATDGRRTS
jgi:hypothetical protein